MRSTAETEEKSADTIMAKYLLNGGKMLARACPACGSPLFEVKGETLCVVCREQKGKPKEQTGAASAVPVPAAADAVAPGGVPVSCEEELAATLVSLCRRARDEKNAERCLAFTEGAKRCAEALAILRHR
ncbi:MAG: hypothetical protein LUQ64_01180 [Methanomicrobiales archaeon]|nr:hypothetical protein [Methanomicrobiales archaeon]